MGANCEERFYKRKLNELEQEVKRLQKEIAKLKILKRQGGRARKQLVRGLHREMELQAVLDTIDYPEVQEEKKQQCKACKSQSLNFIEIANRTIIVCMDCQTRCTIKHNEEIAKTG
jgi:predicted transcriptional regulator